MKNLNQSHPIKLANVLHSKMEFFKPHDIENIRMYVCGPTLHERPHLGKIRSAINFDIIYRTICYVYGEDKVTYVKNYIDVDDRILTNSNKKQTNIEDFTQNIMDEHENDLSRMRVKCPTFTPKSSESIPEIIDMIKILIEKNHAYEKNGFVFFKAKSFEDYGILSGKKNFFKFDRDFDREDSIDFVLWKKDENYNFNSPWGMGRPGPHIEYSAISNDYLGDEFDIFGGGIDLIFPDHENTIAQSHCSTGNIPAKYWIYNFMLTVNGKKMSKSDKNELTLDEFLDMYDLTETQARYVFLKKNYTKVLDLNKNDVDLMKKELDEMLQMVHECEMQRSSRLIMSADVISPLFSNFNTSEFIDNMKELVSFESVIQLKNALMFLDLLPQKDIDNHKKT